MRFPRALLLPWALGLLALPLAACGGDDPDPGPSGNTSPATTGPAPGTGSDSGGQPSTPGGTNTGGPDSTGGNAIDCSKLKPRQNGQDPTLAPGEWDPQVGDIPPNVTLKDAQGNDVNLYDYCNDMVILLAGAGF